MRLYTHEELGHVEADGILSAIPPEGDTQYEKLSKFPFAAITIAGTALAVAFNMGFFHAIGLLFMSVFSLQEHVVFALSGTVVIILVAGWIGSAAHFARIWSQERKERRITTTPMSVGSFMSSGLGALYLTYFDAGRWTAGLLLVSFVLIWVFVTRVLKAFNDLTQVWPVVLFGLLAAYASGIYYGNSLTHSTSHRLSNVVTLKSGSRLTPIRVGSTYTLVLLPNNTVQAVQTTSLVDIVVQPESLGKRTSPPVAPTPHP